MTQSKIKLRMLPSEVKSLAMDEMKNPATVEFLDSLGISMDQADEAIKYVMDAMPTITEGSVVAPVQFLQHWLKKAITVVTQATTADDFLGRTVAGEWHDEEVVLTVRELTGHTRPYGDRANFNYGGYNVNFEGRTIVRFSEALLTGKLEEARMAAIGAKISAYDSDRAAVASAFTLDTNAVAFYGYNMGSNKTYGILNDPNLLDSVAVPTGDASSTEWSTKTFNEIVRDLQTAIAALRKQTGAQFDPYKHAFTLGIASGCVDFLQTMNEHGKSVLAWLKETYGNKMSIVAIPEFDSAENGDNVFYLKAEQLGGNPVVEQIVPAAMRLVGVEQKATGLLELYSNATAGTFVEQPLGIVRYYGI